MYSASDSEVSFAREECFGFRGYGRWKYSGRLAFIFGDTSVANQSRCEGKMRNAKENSVGVLERYAALLGSFVVINISNGTKERNLNY